MTDIPPGWTAIIISVVGVLAVGLPLIFKKNPGINSPTGISSSTVRDGNYVNVGATLVALSDVVADQAERISRLERHEAEYLSRINELEQWGRYSTDPPPRDPPAWIRPTDSGA